MSKKITRREAMKDIFYVGVGLASAGTLLQACASRGAGKAASGVSFTPMPDAPEGSKIDSKYWDGLGVSLGMLGLGCMRLPSRPRNAGGGLDQEAVNEMVDYALAHGINYFDTAPIYGESEVVMGRALSRHPRESYLLATKMSTMSDPNPTVESAKRMFETSLKNLQVDYFDYYLLHNVSSEAGFEKRFASNGVMDYILDLKAQGKIRHLGFSFHGSNKDLPVLLDKYPWEFVQIQLNYVDWKYFTATWDQPEDECSSEALYNILHERNIPIIVMEPVKGGTLANVSDALRDRMLERHPNLSPAGNALSFVGSLPGIMVTLSGMSNMQQLKENVALFTDFKPFGKDDMAFMEEMADLYKANTHVPCTACAYCMPCPNGVDIPGNFKVFNTTSDELSIPDPENKDKDYKQKRKVFLKRYNDLGKDKVAGACIDCNACLPKCPQRIRIPDQLHMISNLVESLG